MAVPFGRCHPGSSSVREGSGRGGATPPRTTRELHLGVRIRLPETELVALGVLADGEPAHAGHGCCLPCLAPEFLDPRGAGVDVVDVEVGPRATLAVGAVEGTAGRLGELRHVVTAWRAGELLELPAEQTAVERLRLLEVVGRDLEMNHLSCHTDSFRRGGAPRSARVVDTTNGPVAVRQLIATMTLRWSRGGSNP